MHTRELLTNAEITLKSSDSLTYALPMDSSSLSQYGTEIYVLHKVNHVLKKSSKKNQRRQSGRSGEIF